MLTRAVDLFAGLGGFTEGARAAGVRVIWAANHWPAAVQWHAANHPDTEHACQDLQQADWTAVPAHDVLLASPSCQGHSKARGKDRPHHDAARSTAWAVVSCAEVHRPPVVVCENVVEWSQWVLWPAWCAAMTALGYALAPMILDAADFGVPQNRRRLIVVGTRTKHPVELNLPTADHVGAASFIDFGAGNWSAIRRQGRAAATLARIEAGRARHGDRFLIPYYKSGSGLTGRSLSRPIGTITTKGRWAVVDGDRMRMVSVNEARAAMGFRRDYALPERSDQAMHMLGNAVCPPMAEGVLNELRRAA